MIPFATPRLLLGIAATMGAIYAADQFLARLEHREIDAQARHEYQSGVTLLHDGHANQAVDAFRRARVLDRDNPAFEVALADALIEDHQPPRAVEMLTAILDKDSNDGRANLLMARAMDAEGQYESADSFYHRAIYGAWPGNAEAERLNTRVELTRWLARRGDRKGLLSELILLEPLTAPNTPIARELPDLFRQAGSQVRAVEAYRNWLRANPTDVAAHAGLGETEMESGNFRAARQAFERAAQLDPDDATLKRRVDLAQAAFELDPTPRQLSSEEKLARSTSILNLAASTVAACATGQGENSASLDAARKLIAQRKTAVNNEAAEARLADAEQIWNARPKSCSPPENAELLTVLMRKIGQ